MNSVTLDLLTDSSVYSSPFDRLHASSPVRDAGLNWRDCSAQGLLVLRTRATGALAVVLKSSAGVALPQALQSDSSDDVCVRWLAPDEYWLSLPLGETARVHQALEEGLGGSGAVIEASGGYGIVQLSGPAVQPVLHKSTGYDTHPAQFTPGKVVGTTFGKATVVLRRLDAQSVEIIVRRSLADYLARWLLQAAAGFGSAPAP